MLLVQKLQHVLPAGVLLVAGLQEFTDRPEGWALALAVTEIVVGLLMVGALAKTAYDSRHLLKRKAHRAYHLHAAVEWENFIAAALVLAEGWEHRMHGGHHFPRPAILAATVLIVTGLLHGRIMRAAARRRTLRVTDAGIYVPGRPFRAKTIDASWPDVKSIEIDDRRAVMTTRAGRVRTLDLEDLEQAEHVRAALLEAQRRALAAPATPDTAE